MTAQNGHSGRIPEDLLLPRNTRRSVPIMLLRARAGVMSRLRPILARHGLSEQQWRVLRVLGEVENREAREVCERACILAPSLTRILKIIEDRGLVTRNVEHPFLGFLGEDRVNVLALNQQLDRITNERTGPAR